MFFFCLESDVNMKENLLSFNDKTAKSRWILFKIQNSQTNEISHQCLEFSADKKNKGPCLVGEEDTPNKNLTKCDIGGIDCAKKTCFSKRINHLGLLCFFLLQIEQIKLGVRFFFSEILNSFCTGYAKIWSVEHHYFF